MGIAVLLGSSRKNGNTDRLAGQLVEGLDAVKLYLSDYNIQPINDYRHSERESFPDDDYLMLMEQVLKQDIIVFATPVYWYGMSGVMKTFVDRWSQSLLENRAGFRAALSAKKAFVIAIGDDEPHLKGLPLIQQFQYIFDFAGITFAGHLLGKGNRPDDILHDAAALIALEELRGKLNHYLAGA